MREIAGTLYLPDGTVTGLGTLTFTAAESGNLVLESTKSTAAVAADGTYSITLRDSRYRVHFNFPDQSLIYLGKIVVEFGATVGIDTLLYASALLVSTDITAYIDAQVLAADYQPAGSYILTGYTTGDTPTTPTGLLLSTTENTEIPSVSFTLKIQWTASTNSSGNQIRYNVSYSRDGATAISTVVSGTAFELNGAVLGSTYVVTVQAVSGPDSLTSPGVATDSLLIATGATPILDTSLISGSPGLNFIVLSWTKPTAHARGMTTIYASTDAGFTISSSNKIFSGLGTTFLYTTASNSNYYFKFVLTGIYGGDSATIGPLGPYVSYKISETTIGSIIEDGAINAQHLIDDIDIQDKLGANTIVAGKLAVLDLTNLVHNQTFEVFDSPTQTYPGWDFGSTPPENYDTNKYVTIGPSTVFDNSLEFACTEGDNFYCSAKLSWVLTPGLADKGLQIVFVDVDGTELNTGYTATNNDAGVLGNDEVVEGFELAPTDTVKGFIRFKTGLVTENITFRNVICRKGSAVMIEDGEITADKINVATLWALNIFVEGTLRTRALSEGNKGVIIGDAIGLVAYNESGVQTFSINPSTGAATFAGTISGATISGSAITGNNISGGTITGGIINVTSKIYGGKATYGAATAGFFLGYSSGYKFHIGTNTDYIKWNGTSFDISKANRGDYGTVSGISGVVGECKSDLSNFWVPGMYGYIVTTTIACTSLTGLNTPAYVAAVTINSQAGVVCTIYPMHTLGILSGKIVIYFTFAGLSGLTLTTGTARITGFSWVVRSMV